MEETITPQEEQHLFDSSVMYTTAPQGSRFVNWLIDNLFMQFALGYATGYVAGMILASVAPEFLVAAYYDKGMEYYFLIFILGLINTLVYYIFCEAAFKGYTLGKLITGTRAVRISGEPLSFRDVLMRSLSRLVPFEAFSGFGTAPWHDTWTKTTVIKAR